MTHGLSPSRALGELPRTDVSQLTEAIEGRRGPLVVTGLADAWPARERWTHAFLMDHFGLSGVGYGKRLDAELARDVSFPAVARLAEQANVWMLPDGYVSELHYDLPHNLNTVLRGSKEVLLFPPTETKHLYAGSPFGAVGPQNSRARLDASSDFPDLRKASYWRAVIGEGETLYIPPFHWHHVRSRGESVAANIWFHLEGRLRRVVRWPSPVIVAAALSFARRALGTRR